MKPILFLLLSAMAAFGQSVELRSVTILGGVEVGSALASQPASPEATNAGQIAGVTINPNGWLAEVTICKMATNGTFNYGFAGSTNNVYSTTNFYLSLTRLGFDIVGNPTTVVARIPATKTIRFPYPDEAVTNRITTNSDYITISCALADFVSAQDSNITATFTTNWYVDSARGNYASASVTCTNNSTQPYGKVIADWAWPAYETVTNETFPLQVVAFHRSASGNPVAGIKFWSISQANQTNAVVWATNPVVVSHEMEAPGAVTVTNYSVIYTASLSCANFNSKQNFTNYFTAYPHVGTTNEWYDTWTLGWQNPKPYPHTMLCNRSNDLGYSYAIVATNGSSSGVVFTNMDTPGTPFATLQQAINAIALTNFFKYSRSNYDGGTVYLTNGDHRIYGGTLTTRDPSQTWLVVAPLPGITTNAAHIEYVDNSTYQGSLRIKFSNLRINMFSNNAAYHNYGFVWWDGVWKETNIQSGALWANGASNIWVTRSTLGHMQNNVRRNTDGNRDISYWRANLFVGNHKIYQSPFFVGNVFLPDTTTNFLFNNGLGGYYSDPVIFAYNRLYRLGAENPSLEIAKTTNLLFGAAIIQNLLEKTATNSAGLVDFCDTASIVHGRVTNLLVWHNTFIGQRWFDRYNDRSNVVDIKFSMLDRNHCNVNDEIGTKFDTFTGEPPPGAHGSRTNRWPVLYSVARVGECWFGPYSVGSFHPQSTLGGGFNGIYSLSLPDIDLTTIDSKTGFFNGQAYRTGAGASSGFGDYRPTNGSVLIGLEPYYLLPYDLGGQARVAGGAAGAFEQ